MRGFIPFLLAAICLLLIGTITAAPLQRTTAQAHWSIDIGTGLFQPGEDRYRDQFDDGVNLRVGVNYKFRSRLILGAQYRYTCNDLDHDHIRALYDSMGWTYFAPYPDARVENHWFGIKAGYDLIERSTAELSFSGLAYIVSAEVDEWRPMVDYYDKHSGHDEYGPGRLEYDHTGLGLGAQFLFAYELSRRIAIGLEAEYNHAWLGTDVVEYTHPTTMALQALVGPAYAYDNVGGFWLAPFVRFEF